MTTFFASCIVAGHALHTILTSFLDGATPVLSSCALVGRTAVNPLAFPVSLVGGGAVPTPPASVGAAAATPNLSRIAGAVARAMGSIRRFCETALPVRVPVPASVIQVE